MMTVDNNDALYVKRTDQSDLNFLCVYYFLLRKGVSFLENFLLKLKTTTATKYSNQIDDVGYKKTDTRKQREL